MTYQEAWNETIERLAKAEEHINEQLKDQEQIKENIRLHGKLQGIRLARNYMREIGSSID